MPIPQWPNVYRHDRNKRSSITLYGDGAIMGSVR